MPRVNRDLQRRMAARRERERRRPGAERRYRFATPEPEEALAEPEVDGAAAAEPIQEAPPSGAPRRAERQPRAETLRPAPKPFSAYRDEYAYVYGDLRRVGAVIGSLLVILIVLYFVLPILVH